MDEHVKDFDDQVPDNSNEQAGGYAKQSSSGENRKSDLRELANNACTKVYRYVGELKNEGHNSLGNLLFQEVMQMTTAASLASESIGKDRFFENLERGFYSSGRLLVYLDFSGTLGVNNTARLEIIESVKGVHKIFAASIKTVKSKQPKLAGAAAI